MEFFWRHGGELNYQRWPVICANYKKKKFNPPSLTTFCYPPPPSPEGVKSGFYMHNIEKKKNLLNAICWGVKPLFPSPFTSPHFPPPPIFTSLIGKEL